jgi:hypothetical protein
MAAATEAESFDAGAEIFKLRYSEVLPLLGLKPRDILIMRR